MWQTRRCSAIWSADHKPACDGRITRCDMLHTWSFKEGSRIFRRTDRRHKYTCFVNRQVDCHKQYTTTITTQMNMIIIIHVTIIIPFIYTVQILTIQFSNALICETWKHANELVMNKMNRKWQTMHERLRRQDIVNTWVVHIQNYDEYADTNRNTNAGRYIQWLVR